jgi:hypothetical protein
MAVTVLATTRRRSLCPREPPERTHDMMMISARWRGG